jgi:hypothetical protein
VICCLPGVNPAIFLGRLPRGKLLILLATPAELPRVASINDLALQTPPKAQCGFKGLFAALTNRELSKPSARTRNHFWHLLERQEAGLPARKIRLLVV